ncbi:aegerolysin family protein [Kitasatospora sp. NPDC096204]|uniref:aegerolysin family protein n=1 Tax=Kitasatospora sp. NPDC096204 TaxID=3364094 RepID=UPI00381F22D3
MAQRKSLVRATLAAAGVAAALFTAAAPAGAATAPQQPTQEQTQEQAQLLSAARSTEVLVVNWTGCELRLQNNWLDHGIWTKAPDPVITDGSTARWQSESNGFMTGTEGHVIYDAANCGNPGLNGKRVQLHWNNPYVGSNGYDTAGSDPKFGFAQSGGSGNNAAVYWTVRGL